MRTIALLLGLTLALVAPQLPAEDAASTPGEAEQIAWAKGIWESLDLRQGKIELPGTPARLEVPEGFYYLDPEDSTKVLVEVWGNPPVNAEGILGMLFPADTTPFDPGSWAVTIAYEEDGYVSDEDADRIDYDGLLAEMRESAEAANKERIAAGYDPIELIGWASRPFYDKSTHKLHWAREIQFGDQPEHTLNYGIRVLGRKGVLVLNFVAGMSQKDQVAGQLDQVLAIAQFDTGSRYQDFVPGVDQVAAYGIGALIAGKVLAKTGLMVAALIFLKKFWVLIAIGLGALGTRLFRRRRDQAQ
jgi:uncharacterized membrane-anchored protein